MKKRALIAAVLLCAIVLTVYAVGTKITLDSSKPMFDQIEAFRAWYDDLGILDKAQWDLMFSDLTSGDSMFFEPAALAQLPESGAAYVLKKGTAFHVSAFCRYVKTKTNVETLSIAEAISKGYTPCSVCAKHLR